MPTYRGQAPTTVARHKPMLACSRSRRQRARRMCPLSCLGSANRIPQWSLRHGEGAAVGTTLPLAARWARVIPRTERTHEWILMVEELLADAVEDEHAGDQSLKAAAERMAAAAHPNIGTIRATRPAARRLPPARLRRRPRPGELPGLGRSRRAAAGARGARSRRGGHGRRRTPGRAHPPAGPGGRGRRTLHDRLLAAHLAPRPPRGCTSRSGGSRPPCSPCAWWPTSPRPRLPASAVHPRRDRHRVPHDRPLRVRHVRGIPTLAVRMVTRVPEPVREAITRSCTRVGRHQHGTERLHHRAS